jgi:hypothetical protein
MASPENAPARSPFAGCLIMMILAAVAVFVIAVSAYSLIQQNKEIDKFTVAEPTKLPEITIEGREAAMNDLHARLQRFRDAVLSPTEQAASIELSTDDLNHVLAAMEPLRDYRGSFFVKEVGDGVIVADHTRPMNGMPGSGKMRYLNAEITLKPLLAEKALVFQVLDLKVPGKTVPREFIAQIPPYRLGVGLEQDPVLGPVLQKLTAMEAKPGKLELRRKTGDVPQSTVSNQQVDSAFLRILRVLICGFLVVVGLGLFFALRAKGKRERAQHSPSPQDLH